MPNVVKLSLALLAASLAVGLPSTALASPVVDQYTEQVPTPGGPRTPDQNTGNPGAQSDAGGESSVPGFSPAGETPTGSDASNPARSAGGNQSDDADRAEGVEQADEGNDDSFTLAGTAGGNDGDGMGWVFPAALVLIAMVIAGIAIVRRNRSNPAT